MTGSGHEMVGITRKYKEEDRNKYCTGEIIDDPVHYWMPNLAQSLLPPKSHLVSTLGEIQQWSGPFLAG